MTRRRHADWAGAPETDGPSARRDASEPPEAAPEAPPEALLGAEPPEAADIPDALARLAADDRFEFRLTGGRGFILDFEKGRDVINLEGLGLTPWDLTPSIQGRDLALAFEGGEVILRGAAGVHLDQWDFRY
ncbi:hypothetical protein SAMN05444336_104282 [Albimonas donghaensis]|uniref:Uncharacterized protein n=1 Tax=Albimonas donghaensis TaxID=356660 RepID=A0A1H3ARX1_9RHOB|nr:hypothetical protein [Albimonas donghaensis]SDX31884.1 hypothetical protein SAMN05444336_104282 [Albimonas donghaensis]